MPKGKDGKPDQATLPVFKNYLRENEQMKVSFSLNKELYGTFRLMCKANGISCSSAVEALMQQALELAEKEFKANEARYKDPGPKPKLK